MEDEEMIEVNWYPRPPSPEFLLTLLHKRVEVLAKGDRMFGGILFTVDPVTYSIVLFNENPDATSRVELVMGHAVRSVKVNLRESFEPQRLAYNFKSNKVEDNLVVKRERLKKWLARNLLDVVIDGENLKIPWADDLIISPPYDENSVISGNEIVMGNVRRLIESMPEVF